MVYKPYINYSSRVFTILALTIMTIIGLIMAYYAFKFTKKAFQGDPTTTDKIEKTSSAISDKAKKVADGIFKTFKGTNMDEGQIQITITVIALCILLGIMVITYYFSQRNKYTNNCNRMDSKVDKRTEKMTIGGIKPNDKRYQERLTNYYVKSSYNSCCAGDFKNDFVNLCALRDNIKLGARLLDFEIYSVDGKPVVAASSSNEFTIKETYNYLTIYEVMELIGTNAFGSATCPNSNDPLFINLRIKTSRTDIYPTIADAIKTHLGNRLLSSDFGNEQASAKLNNTSLKDLMGKVIIICNHNNKETNTSLNQYINYSNNNVNMKLLTNFEVVFTPNASDLIEFNKQNITVSIPDLSSRAKNVPVSVHMKYGVQFICVNNQLDDEHNKFVEEYFNKAGCAFALKPKDLCFVPNVVSAPTPQKPELSFAPRTADVPGGIKIMI